MNNPIRVLLVDDSERVREDLRRLLDLSAGIEVIGEAASGVEGVYQAEILEPDMVLLDLDMGRYPVPQGNYQLVEMDGCAAIPVLKANHPAMKVYVLSVHEDAETRRVTLLAGADDYFVKGRDTQRLLETLKTLASRLEG
jgi:DNA-binding NarL/FixJ family response regulator